MKTSIYVAALHSIAAGLLVGCATPITTQPVMIAQQDSRPTYVGVPYGKLCSEAFVSDYAGKAVSFKAMFVGEWTLTQAYATGGVDTRSRVFLNHRDVSYRASDTALGSTDMAFPGFALSIEKARSDIVYELKRGDIFEVQGVTRAAGMVGKLGLHISIDTIRKAEHE